MRIDPMVMKQLLELQFTGSSSYNGSAVGTDFADMLEQLLGSAEFKPSGRIIPAAELLAKGRLAFSSTAVLQGMISYPSSQGLGSPSEYDGLIREASNRHGVEEALVKAVVKAESSFNPNAVSKAGAKGLMQLMDQTGAGLGVRNPFDPQQNIEGGTRFLAGLLRKYNGNEGVALAAYNAGPGRVDRLGIRTDQELREKLHLLPKETQGYVSKVLDFKRNYQV